MSHGTERRGLDRLVWLAGLALVGYGGLVAMDLIAHESLLAAAGSLLLGGFLLLRGDPPSAASGRPALVAGLGLAALAGVVFYNLTFDSGFSPPEWGLVLYGLALLAAAANLDASLGSLEVETLVAWSFPLLLGPLALFAFDAALAGPRGTGMRSLADPFIAHALVTPMALTLQALGTPVEKAGTHLVLETADGSLTLGVGLVCAGVYPLLLFAGLLGLHAWQNRSRPRKALAHFGIGAAGLYVFNLARLVVLAKIGERWGAWWLQTVHAHLGWILYGIFALLFWIVIVPRTADPS